jgi:hypothetical protein
LKVNKLLVTFTDTLIEEVCTSSLNILIAIKVYSIYREVSSTNSGMDELIRYVIVKTGNSNNLRVGNISNYISFGFCSWKIVGGGEEANSSTAQQEIDGAHSGGSTIQRRVA